MAASTSPAATEYGLLSTDALRQAQARLTSALQQFAERLGQSLEKALDDAASLEVATYISDNLSEVKYQGGAFTGPVQLRALTRVRLDGDTLVCVPEEHGEVDGELWEIHAAMVERAAANRAELIKAVASAASGLLQSLKGV